MSDIEKQHAVMNVIFDYVMTYRFDTSEYILTLKKIKSLVDKELEKQNDQ